jgi:hypothetical protein
MLYLSYTPVEPIRTNPDCRLYSHRHEGRRSMYWCILAFL